MKYILGHSGPDTSIFLNVINGILQVYIVKWMSLNHSLGVEEYLICHKLLRMSGNTSSTIAQTDKLHKVKGRPPIKTYYTDTSFYFVSHCVKRKKIQN